MNKENSGFEPGLRGTRVSFPVPDPAPPPDGKTRIDGRSRVAKALFFAVYDGKRGEGDRVENAPLRNNPTCLVLLPVRNTLFISCLIPFIYS